MARFLTTTKISSELEDLIKNAHDDLTFISPYLKVNQRLQDLIRDANLQRRVRFTLIYGKQTLKPEERSWIDALTTKDVSFLQNLHAKCYLNEDTAIITSMNLYEFSQQNNDEMGILVNREEDPDLYRDIAREAQRLRRAATPDNGEQAQQSRPQPKEQTVRSIGEPKRPPPTVELSYGAKGHCIRCEKVVDFDPDKPLCRECYKIWARYGDETFGEKFCHNCRKQAKTSVARPLCGPCYQKARDLVNVDDLPF